MENHRGDIGACFQDILWESLCEHSLSKFFLEVLGEEARIRPLQVCTVS